MKWTRANVEEWARERGLEPVTIDGIPEGFSFKEPELTIGDEHHAGSYVAYIPLSDESVYAITQEDLLVAFSQKTK